MAPGQDGFNSNAAVFRSWSFYKIALMKLDLPLNSANVKLLFKPLNR